jgi:hypothetical protein
MIDGEDGSGKPLTLADATPRASADSFCHPWAPCSMGCLTIAVDDETSNDLTARHFVFHGRGLCPLVQLRPHNRAWTVSDNLIPIITDEQAKLGQELIKAGRDLGAFFGRALGTTPEDLIGYLFGDRLHIHRVEAFIRMLMEAKHRLEERGVREPQPATLSIALPIARAAADEDRDELVDLWARLLANAVDPNLRSVRYRFIDAVKQMDPMDAKLLQHLYRKGTGQIRVGAGGGSKETSVALTAQQLLARQDDVEVSVRNLHALGFLTVAPIDQNMWHPNAMMREFMRACYPEIKPA